MVLRNWCSLNLFVGNLLLVQIPYISFWIISFHIDLPCFQLIISYVALKVNIFDRGLSIRILRYILICQHFFSFSMVILITNKISLTRYTKNHWQNQFNNNYCSDINVTVFWNNSCGNLQQLVINGKVVPQAYKSYNL